MGVVGLWQLLDPTGRPVRLETLEGKILAVDISIWLNQLVKGYRGAGGQAVDNAHLLGLFQRVCKLLHYKIKPVFVFDGKAPDLKYQTLASRKRRREDGSEAIRKATEKMLKTYVEQKFLGEANPKLPKVRPTRHQREAEDLFKLPQHSMLIGEESEDSMSDTDLTYNADLANIKIDSEEFKSLPNELQHEFLVALKEREKRGARPVDELPVDRDDFSSFQMANLLKKNKLQAKIESVRNEMNDGLLRMASNADVQLLVKITPQAPFELNLKGEKEEENENEEDNESPLKKPKLEALEEESAPEPDEGKRVENFLVSQWLEGAQRGEEANETLKKAVELVHDDEPDVISDSSANSSDDERPTNVRKRLPSTGGKVSAEEAMRQLEPPSQPAASGVTDTTRDSLASDGLSLDVGHGSIVSASTTRIMQPEEQFDEGSATKKSVDSDDVTANNAVVAANKDVAAFPPQPDEHFEDSADQSCNTDVLNADLEVSETGNSVFKMEEAVERSKSLEEDASPQSSESCKLTEVTGTPVIKEVSFLGTTQSSLNSNDDIVLPHNLSRYASKDPSRCNSNSMGFVPAATGTTSLSDNPTDFHQALEIIKEQERRQSECLEDKDAANLHLLNGNSEIVVKSEPSSPILNDDVSMKTDPETNNNIDVKSESVEVRNSSMSTEAIEARKEQLQVRSLALQNEINRIQRQTSEITASMTEDCEELLKMFGIPCVRAPREAEAQCAALEAAGLVQGVVTDDSDIFLFGGSTVYKNLFSQDHQCEMFTAKTIESNLKLSRDDLIGFAMLTGSDYTNGIENVGPVMACEILAEFRSGNNVLKTLADFKEWWSLSQRGATLPKNSIRTRFIKLLLEDRFPNEKVYTAYIQPTVDRVEEKFAWSRPDLDLLRGYMMRKFNWPQDKTDGYLLPIMKRYDDKQMQSKLDRFLLPSIQKRENLFPSKRLKAAVSKLKVLPQRDAKLSESSSDSD